MGKIAIIQMTSLADPAHNIEVIENHLKSLSTQAVDCVLLPENALIFGVDKDDYHRYAKPLCQGFLYQSMAEMARAYQLMIVIGSMPVLTERGVTTTCVAIDAKGKYLAHYDKLHMFDAKINDAQGIYTESNYFVAGNELTVMDSPIGQCGLSICYDLRFPQLYNQLAKLGAKVLLVPAAFTYLTGKAHWQTLLTARAIETQSWVVGANQTGTSNGRQTWGHSMIVNPWGEIVAELETEEGTLVADIDLALVEHIRSAMPMMSHSRFLNHCIKK